MVPGEGFLLVSFTNQYSLTIYGIEPGCGGGCTPLTCSFSTVLAGDYGLEPNPVPFCDLFCCPPVDGTEVQVWDATSQSFTTYVYSGTWSPSLPPPLPVGYSEFVSVDTSLPVINCPTDIITNGCADMQIFFNVTASNAFGGALTPTVNPPSGSEFTPGNDHGLLHSDQRLRSNQLLQLYRDDTLPPADLTGIKRQHFQPHLGGWSGL